MRHAGATERQRAEELRDEFRLALDLDEHATDVVARQAGEEFPGRPGAATPTLSS
ncbi:hypothetical protein GCM10027200_11930 [Lentzea nigeriaca]